MKPEEKAQEKIGKLSNCLPNGMRSYSIKGLPHGMFHYSTWGLPRLPYVMYTITLGWNVKLFPKGHAPTFGFRKINSMED